MTLSRALAACLLTVSVVSVWFGALAIFSAFACFLFWVTLPALETRERRALLVVASLALLLSFVGIARFVANQAFFGMSEAARLTTSRSVVSRLREIKFAESRAMELKLVDPNRSGRGSALFLDELSASRPLRTTAARTRPLLDAKYKRRVDTDNGPAVALNGYLFFVCLPGADGSLTADPRARVDERAAESRFIAVGWPASMHQGHGQLFAIDAEGNVRVSDNRSAEQRLVFVGTERPPPCNLVETEASGFSPWRGKESRPDSARPASAR